MKQVSYAVDEGIATITLSRAERLNAFTDTMESELIEAFDQADLDDDVRVVILTGTGRAFCAGMDLAEAAEPADSFRAWRSSAGTPDGAAFGADGDGLPYRRDGGGRVVLRIYRSDKPVIAAINGHAVGVGATMTLPADVRIAADSARFAFPFVRRAFVPESCSSWFLPRVVPVQTAFEWMLTGRTFDAAEALHGGLVRSLHPAQDVLTVARGLATEIAANTSPVSVALTRRMLWRMLEAPHPMTAHEVETAALNVRGVSADAAEGIRAFLDKRTPHFVDRISTGLPDVFAGLPEPDFVPPESLT